MQNNFRYIAMGSIIVLFVATIALGLIWFQEKEEPRGRDTDSANWKTYYNERYGFEVKYPPGLKEEAALSHGTPNMEGVITLRPISEQEREGSLTISVISKRFEEYPFNNPSLRSGIHITPEKVRIGAADFYHKASSDAGCGAEWYYLPNGSVMFEFLFSQCENLNSGVSFIHEEQGKILSTFTFLD